ncbi:MAG: diguanylate cyclase [Sulfitobacter sp.]|nr:diguanylate cyclase [Sulfitobacter sp.]
MLGKILIVDPIATNRIMLKTKLGPAFYDVRQATSVADALDQAKQDPPDLVITAFQLTDADATAMLDGLARGQSRRRIPVIAIGENESAALRQLFLSRGARDVLVKPLADSLLLSRVRSLIRLYHANEEWHVRAETSRVFGLSDPPARFQAAGHVQLVGSDKGLNHIWAGQLRRDTPHKISVAAPEDAMKGLSGDGIPDVFVLVLTRDPAAITRQMHLISSIRSNARTRYCGIIVVQTTADPDVAANALDMGADDLMPQGFNLEELHLRLTALLERKTQIDRIRASVDLGLREAIFDPLTGLYNRRYGLAEMTRQTSEAKSDDLPFAVMMADMDHFKRINDKYGHAKGDAVLVETARRLRSHLRPRDMVARMGGEEFLLLLPATWESTATAVANRLCKTFEHTPFVIPGIAEPFTVTISIGLCMISRADLTGCDISLSAIDWADKALYAAKNKGRNRVLLGRPAA